MRRIFASLGWMFAAGCLLVGQDCPAQQPVANARVLPSWNDGQARTTLLDFIQRVTTEGSPDFVPVPARIAVFDNDGTLWCEQPLLPQTQFLIDRIRAVCESDAALGARYPGVIKDGLDGFLALGPAGRAELLAATDAGLSTDAFTSLAHDWITTARHPRFHRPYSRLVYQPMLELLDYLAAHKFQCYLVSGCGVEFLRSYSEEAYGIPPERVIGTTVALRFALRGGEPVVLRGNETTLLADREGKVIGIEQQIGRRPILAFGNSDGDIAMLQWTTSAPGPRLGLLLHHTDPDREYRYDRQSLAGRLDQGFAEAEKRHWQLVDMKADWAAVFPAEGKPATADEPATRAAAQPAGR